MSDEIADTINNSSKPWMHAYTYSGHPTTCAVGLATLDIIEGEDLPGQAATKGVRMLENLHETLDSHPHVGNVRGLGLMMGVEVVKDKADKSWFEPEFNLGGNRGLLASFKNPPSQEPTSSRNAWPSVACNTGPLRSTDRASSWPATSVTQRVSWPLVRIINPVPTYGVKRPRRTPEMR